MDEVKEPPYSIVAACGNAYQKERDNAIGRRNCVWNNRNLECATNWKHFRRAARQCQKLKIEVSEWMYAQFEYATNASYPFPNQTYGKKALLRWQHSNLHSVAPALLRQMNSDMQVYMVRYNMTASEVVSNVRWTEFFGWFRAIYMDADKLSPRIKSITRSALKSTAIRCALRDARDADGRYLYDIAALERKVQ